MPKDTTTVAVLGATGHIGRGLAAELLKNPGFELFLYARRPEHLSFFLDELEPGGKARAKPEDIENFGEKRVDIIINATGAGDPKKLHALGDGIKELTERFDRRVLGVLADNPDALYLNMSSGAVYDSDFSSPAGPETTIIDPARPGAEIASYSVAKTQAEARHRERADFNIVDLRVFSFFSRYIDTGGRFFIADLVRAIQANETLITDAQDLYRDYVHAEDLARLVVCVIKAWRKSDVPFNRAFDVYSRGPAGKFEIIKKAEKELGLRYRVAGDEMMLSPTGPKTRYYSINTQAMKLGYLPRYDSISTITQIIKKLLEG